MTIEEKRVLKTLTYYYGAGFCNFPNFFNAINEVGELKKTLIKNEAEYQIYNEELKRLFTLQKTTKIEKNLLLDFSKIGYMSNYRKIQACMSKIFPIDQWPKLHIIDEKLPIQGNEYWESMIIDNEDENFFGFEAGIYYQRKYLTHAYFEFIIAHELTHWIISQYSKEYFPYVSIYEEGLCDLFSAFFLKESGVITTAAINNLYMYNRHFKPQNSLWKNYNIYMNEMITYGLKYGDSFLINVIKGGRSKVQNIRSEIKKFKKEYNGYNNQFREMLFNLLGVNSYFSVDIEMYIVMKYLDERKVDSIEYDLLRKEMNLPDEQIKDAMRKLNGNGYLFFNGNKIFLPNRNISIKMRYRNE